MQFPVINECPVSYITPESAQLVDLVLEAGRINKASGGVMFGPDAARWPAWYADAVGCVETQRLMEEAARP